MDKFDTKKKIIFLFNDLKLRYLENNEMIFPEIEKTDLRKSLYYNDNKEEFIYLEEKYGEKLRNNCTAPVHVQKVDDQIGYGLFASKPLRADDLIGEYSGIVQEAFSFDPSDKETSVKTEYAWDFPDEIPGLPPLEINARFAGGVLRFVNHSFQPNLRIEHTIIDNEWKIFFTADVNIKEGTELFVDYGDVYWSVESREIILP
jgi:uncharacterized protein